MYKYKRKIDNINDIRKSTFTLSDKESVCLNLNSDFTVTKPFNGLYIKNGMLIISNIFETIETKKNRYKIKNIVPLSNNASNDYISNIDLENYVIEYDTDDFYFSKRIFLEEKTGILAVEYNIKNKTEYDMTFNTYPAITYRELFKMKNSTMLRFNQRNEENGVVINLSVTNSEDLVLRSDNLTWNKDVSFITDVQYNVREDVSSVKKYFEDLLVPGYFDVNVKSDENAKVVIYVSLKEIDISKLSVEEISKKDFFLKEKIANSIENEFVELKELYYGIDKLNFENKLITTLPYKKEEDISLKQIDITNLDCILENLIDLAKSIEGEFLTFGKVKEATKRIINIKKYIDYIDLQDITDYELRYKFCLLKLWCIESINRIIQKQDLINVFFELTQKSLNSVISDEKYNDYLNNIEFTSLIYNALKIYEDMLQKKGQDSSEVFSMSKVIQEKIENEFWQEENRVMKKCLDEGDVYANIQMLYTISLSFPCVTGDIQFKLMDTIFKELYTPYGLREYAKSSDKNTGLIYPKYMAHFVKANLRQSGITRASQKIAYNLVKELLSDLNKYVNCGVKKVYSEKGYQIDTMPYDLLTNAEIIRLYDMLT